MGPGPLLPSCWVSGEMLTQPVASSWVSPLPLTERAFSLMLIHCEVAIWGTHRERPGEVKGHPKMSSGRGGVPFWFSGPQGLPLQLPEAWCVGADDSGLSFLLAGDKAT